MLQYLVIDLCGDQFNTFFTAASFVHLSLQPLFINVVAMYFIPESVRQKIFKPVMIVGAFAAVLIFTKLIPQSIAGECIAGTQFCAKQFCTTSGLYHLVWQFPLNGLYNAFPIPMALPGYSIFGLLLPVLYGSWRFVIFLLLTGPLTLRLFIHDPSEVATIWCLFSVAIIVVLFSKQLDRLLRVNHWWVWKYLK